MGKVKELIAQVQEQAEKELEYCNSKETPYVCNLISTPAGKQQIIDLIIEYVGRNGMSISDAIVYIERDKNPNLEN